MNSEEWQKDSLGNWGSLAGACECPNCENGGECLRGFCTECLEELEDAAPWGAKCDKCSAFDPCTRCGTVAPLDGRGYCIDCIEVQERELTLASLQVLISAEAPTHYPLPNSDSILLIIPTGAGVFDVHHMDGGCTNWGEVMTAEAVIRYLDKLNGGE